jgi:hypothetical protein
MSASEKESIEQNVENVVAKYSMRNLRTMIILAFLAGGWATTLQIQLLSLTGAHESALKKLEAWSTWRSSVDDFVKSPDRFTARDYDMAAEIFNRQKPVVQLPSFREVMREK